MSIEELEMEAGLLRVKSKLTEADAVLSDLETLFKGHGDWDSDAAVDGATKAGELRQVVRSIADRLPKDSQAYRLWEEECKATQAGPKEEPKPVAARAVPADPKSRRPLP